MSVYFLDNFNGPFEVVVPASGRTTDSGGGWVFREVYGGFTLDGSGAAFNQGYDGHGADYRPAPGGGLAFPVGPNRYVEMQILPAGDYAGYSVGSSDVTMALSETVIDGTYSSRIEAWFHNGFVTVIVISGGAPEWESPNIPVSARADGSIVIALAYNAGKVYLAMNGEVVFERATSTAAPDGLSSWMEIWDGALGYFKAGMGMPDTTPYFWTKFAGAYETP